MHVGISIIRHIKKAISMHRLFYESNNYVVIAILHCLFRELVNYKLCAISAFEIQLTITQGVGQVPVNIFLVFQFEITSLASGFNFTDFSIHISDGKNATYWMIGPLIINNFS